jgi:RNA polymerase sigma factor (sigma-70 family)
MQRHGPLVLGVCLRVLHDPNDADDAFQATFLVLARKADSVGQPDWLANWLYGVALRVARKARSATARRPARHLQVTEMAATESTREAEWNDLRQVLDEEVGRLPEKFRLPILLCYFEGRTREETARLLGWSAGAVKGMLERGRVLLHSRLSRRGVTLSATALAGLLSKDALSAAVPASLGDGTIKVALLFATANAVAAGNAAALAEGVLQAMWIKKLKVTILGLLALALVGAGAGVLAVGGRPADADDQATADPVPKAAGKADQLKKQAAARLDLAKANFEGYLARFEFARDSEDVVNLWSRRWLQAQLELSDNKADREAALQAHLERLKKVDGIARARLALGNSFNPLAPKLDPEVEPKQGFESIWKDYEALKASPEQVYNASVRWLVAQQQFRKFHNKVPQADPSDLQAHLDRMKELEESVKVRAEAGLLSELDSNTATFHRLQAEEWLAHRKTFNDDVLVPGGRLLEK